MATPNVTRRANEMMTLRTGAAVLASLLAIAGTAAAQGRGNGRGSPQSPTRSSGQPAATPVALQPSPSFPQFGTWIDDATTAQRGAGYGSVGATYWRGLGANQIDAPILGLSYGLTNRVQLSANVPFYHANYDGFSGSGLDNVYVSGKIAVVDPNRGSRRVGVAVSGVAEILSAGFADASRAHWAVPIAVELRAAAVRFYGSTGYFSRGALFAAAAMEWTAPTGASLTASLAHSQSVRGLTVATTATMPRASLRDVSVFVSHPLSSIASAYVGGSRSFSSMWIDRASSVSAGLVFRFASPRHGNSGVEEAAATPSCR
jgi:hypothetical protein